MKNGPKILFVIKSAVTNLERRMAIRQTWGFERRFPNAPIRTVFLLGVSQEDGVKKSINDEDSKFNDIVQSDFLDSYDNNTLKTMSGFKWAIENCHYASFAVFTGNILIFVLIHFKLIISSLF